MVEEVAAGADLALAHLRDWRLLLMQVTIASVR